MLTSLTHFYIKFDLFHTENLTNHTCLCLQKLNQSIPVFQKAWPVLLVSLRIPHIPAYIFINPLKFLPKVQAIPCSSLFVWVQRDLLMLLRTSCQSQRPLLHICPTSRRNRMCTVTRRALYNFIRSIIKRSGPLEMICPRSTRHWFQMPVWCCVERHHGFARCIEPLHSILKYLI